MTIEAGDEIRAIENSMLSGDQPDDVRMVETKPSRNGFAGKPYSQTANDRQVEAGRSMEMIQAVMTPLEVTAKVGVSNWRRKYWRKT